MKININGKIREMTPEEEAQWKRDMEEIQDPEPSPEERIAQLERDNADLKEALEMLLSGVVEDG